MDDDTDLIDRIFAVTSQPDGPLSDDCRAHLWSAGIVIIADILLRSDELTRERLLRGIECELRKACAGITELMTHGQPEQPGLPSVGAPDATQH